MNSAWVKTRQTKFATYAVVYTLIVLAVLAMANYLANRYNKAYDATSNKRFSLSDQTVKIVKGLRQDIKLSYFDAPTRFAPAKDLLDRYQNLSPKIHVAYIDPPRNPGLTRSLNVRSEGTTVVENGPRHEEAKALTEEGITGAILRTVKTGDRYVCSVEGNGEHRFDETAQTGYSGVKTAAERDNYKTRSINLLEKADVPQDCTALVIGGPKSDYVQPEVTAIKSYVEKGGRALFLLDPPLKLGRQETADNTLLTDMLADWGVTVNKDLVLDPNQLGQLFGLGPEVPIVNRYEGQAIVRDLTGTMTAFPITRSLDVKAGGKTTVEKLFSSSVNSFATANLSSAEIKVDPNKDKKGPFVLAAAGTYNNGQPNKPGRFVVVGSSGWTDNSFIRFNGNRDLLLNMVNWLASDEDLISIRPKEPEDQHITLTGSQMRTVGFASQFGLPLLVLLAGVSVWWRRR